MSKFNERFEEVKYPFIETPWLFQQSEKEYLEELDKDCPDCGNPIFYCQCAYEYKERK